MNIQMIPLDKLIPSPANVRKTEPLTGIKELAANIRALGLLQNLQVRANDDGSFAVEAGRRRHAALKLLVRQKVVAPDEPIACRMLGEDENATEVSLAENFMRLPMHPADQYDAFKALVDQGKGHEEIAARFGCSPITIKQRLKLAAVAPALMQAYRKDEMGLDQLMAFTVSDDHAAQEQVWASLPHWNHDPDTIRSHLMVAHVEASDRRVQFVTLRAYKKAGGHVLRDLFQPDHEGYLTDPVLLDRLVIGKLEKAAKAIRAEGWKWVAIIPASNSDHLRGLGRVYPEREPPGEEQQAEIDALTAQYDALIEEHGGDPPEEIAAELESLNEKIDALSEDTERWLPEDVGRAGAVIGIGHGGRLAVERGLVRPDDRLRTGNGKAVAERASGKVNGSPAPGSSPGQALSDRLTEELTAHRTAALRVMLAGNSDVALASVVHALALPLFFPHEDESCLELSLDSASLHGSAEGIEDSPAGAALAERHQTWLRRLPKTQGELWDWLLAQDTATRLDLLAYCAGCAVNAVRKRHERDTDRLAHADRLATALGLDMTLWWKATAESYFRQVPKAIILEAVREGHSPEAAENLAKLKKEALAAEAEQRLKDSGWLPVILRSSTPVTEPALDALAAE